MATVMNMEKRTGRTYLLAVADSEINSKEYVTVVYTVAFEKSMQEAQGSLWFHGYVCLTKRKKIKNYLIFPFPSFYEAQHPNYHKIIRFNLISRDNDIYSLFSYSLQSSKGANQRLLGKLNIIFQENYYH